MDFFDDDQYASEEFCCTEADALWVIAEAYKKKGIVVQGLKHHKLEKKSMKVVLQCCRLRTESINRLAKALDLRRSWFSSCPEGHSSKK